MILFCKWSDNVSNWGASLLQRGRPVMTISFPFSSAMVVGFRNRTVFFMILFVLFWIFHSYFKYFMILFVLFWISTGVLTVTGGCWIKFQVWGNETGKWPPCGLLRGEILPQISARTPDTNHKDHQIKYLPLSPTPKFHISPQQWMEFCPAGSCVPTPVNIRKLLREVPRRLSQMPAHK